MGNSGTRRRQAETNRWDVFSSANNRPGIRFFLARSLDFLWKRFRVSESVLYQHQWRAEMLCRFLHRLGFLINRDHFPCCDAAASEVRLPTSKRIAKRNTGKLGLAAFLDDVARNQISL
jgi:hypothetical protein